jgi:hypothetical protein
MAAWVSLDTNLANTTRTEAYSDGTSTGNCQDDWWQQEAKAKEETS